MKAASENLVIFNKTLSNLFFLHKENLELVKRILMNKNTPVFVFDSVIDSFNILFLRL